MSKSPDKRSFLGGVLLALAAVLLYGLLFPLGCNRLKVQGRRAHTQAQVNQMVVAMKAHITEYGFRPTGDNAAVMATFRGGNPRKIVFFEANPQSFNAKGELIDLWGTPYRIEIADGAEPRVWSCGKDRRDDGGAPGSDDVVSWP